MRASQTGFAFALLLAIACATPAMAADLGGSLKDSGWDSGAAAAAATAAGPCYWRADTGYSWSQDPSSQYAGNPDLGMGAQRLGSRWFADAGLGCGSGSRGWRGEAVLGVREAADFGGDYIDFAGAPVSGRLTTSIRSYTAMFNGYYDLGNMNGIVPFIGAGIGLAYHDMGDVHSDLAPGSQHGADNASFAWSLMAGFGYQLTDRAILDVGYRYIDLGSARSSFADNGSRLEVKDIAAHEFKIGLRYHFGSAASPVPVK